MSTNIYPYRETIWYSDKPTHRWGWHLSTSSDDRSLAMLTNRKATDSLVQIVLGKMKVAGFGPTCATGAVGEIEALFVMAHYAGGDDQEWFYDVITHTAPDQANLWTFLLDLVCDPEIAEILSR